MTRLPGIWIRWAQGQTRRGLRVLLATRGLGPRRPSISLEEALREYTGWDRRRHSAHAALAATSAGGTPPLLGEGETARVAGWEEPHRHRAGTAAPRRARPGPSAAGSRPGLYIITLPFEVHLRARFRQRLDIQVSRVPHELARIALPSMTNPDYRPCLMLQARHGGPCTSSKLVACVLGLGVS